MAELERIHDMFDGGVPALGVLVELVDFVLQISIAGPWVRTHYDWSACLYNV